MKVPGPPTLLRTIQLILDPEGHLSDDFTEVSSLGFAGFPDHNGFKCILSSKNTGCLHLSSTDPPRHA